ncbi:putative Zn(2)-C6 fungal-type domain-containing protein [Seiridium unicorne]|uniref:Zn(2)-C6 fungal-type domain-containing protein n=1 Tax=Seiridium unicorne TaxID=138068 RepID=A0ABR2UR43_9PEZI
MEEDWGTERKGPDVKRKIKCDEDKPACYRCTSTGRHCGGYQPPELRVVPRRLLHNVQAEGLLVTSLATSNDEHRAFEQFLRSGTSALGCQADADLWRSEIPQLFHSEPSIRHAAIAIGSLLVRNDFEYLRRKYPTRVPAVSDYNCEDEFAIDHYQKAIRSTLTAIEDGTGNASIAGITCLLFFSIEALQGHEKEALQLFESGNKAQLRPGAGTTSDSLTESFSRLAVQWSMFEGHVADISEHYMEPTEPITSIFEAQKELTRLILLAFKVAADGFPLKWTPPSPSIVAQGQGDCREAWRELNCRERNLHNALQLWHTRFLAYTNRHPHKTQTMEDTIWCGILLLRYRSIFFWLIGSMERSELIYDKYLPQFKLAVAGARETLTLMEQSGRMLPFSVELGVIPPLYIIISKCRDPMVRREALAVLRRAPVQESLWNRDIIIQVSERIIELEEGSDGFIHDFPPDMAGMVIPESMRLKFVKIGLRTIHEDGRKGDFVEFHSLPHGFKREWCVSHEFFAA